MNTNDKLLTIKSDIPKFHEKATLFLYALDHKLINMLKSDQELINALIDNEVIVVDKDRYVINTEQARDYVKDYRALWRGTSKSGDNKTVATKMRRFSTEYNISYDEIIDLARYYVNNYERISGILQGANYFLYKQKLIKGNRVTTSRAAELLDEFRDRAAFKTAI